MLSRFLDSQFITIAYPILLTACVVIGYLIAKRKYVKKNKEWKATGIESAVIGIFSLLLSFTFLASNDVDNPELFPEPVKAGVLIQARLIRESIRNASHPSHFYQGQFSWEVERVLRTVDKFKNKGVDFRPAVKELRDAFNEKSEFEKPKWAAIAWIDEWLKKNG